MKAYSERMRRLNVYERFYEETWIANSSDRGDVLLCGVDVWGAGYHKASVP
jgi:hypothetical protein